MRIDFGADGPITHRGPFVNPESLVAGFWLLKVKDLDEAVEYMKRAPIPGGEVEIRPIMEDEDLASVDPTGAIRASEAALRAQIAARA